MGARRKPRRTCRGGVAPPSRSPSGKPRGRGDPAPTEENDTYPPGIMLMVLGGSRHRSGEEASMAAFPPPTTHRPAVMAAHYVASTNHYLATLAATRLLESGGNAIDAGVAAGLCINVLQPDMTNLGGVAPIILYS